LTHNKQLKKFLILRNNDLGDVLVATPLVSGIRKAFPESHIAIGVGDWAKPLLENNSDLDQIVPCNAPWHNKQNCHFPANSLRTYMKGLCYVFLSKEARHLTHQKFSHGIDVLGSRQGSWLLRRARISKRYGVKGYAGGDSWCHKNITFNPNIHVAQAGLNFLTLFNEECNIEARPKIYLTREEIDFGRRNWQSPRDISVKIVIAPGGGFKEKCWGDDYFSQLSSSILEKFNCNISIIGSLDDRFKINVPVNDRIKNLCGTLDLRQSAAIVSQSDFVISNSSLPMHLAGAFKIPSLILLGGWYDSTELHHKQWGYPESTILGKEISSSKIKIASIKEALNEVESHFLKTDNFNF